MHLRISLFTSVVLLLNTLSVADDGWQQFGTHPGLKGKFHAYNADEPVHFTASVSEQNGYGGLRKRFATQFVIRNDGTAGHGYGLQIYRGDQNYNNSTIMLMQDDRLIDSIRSPFQFSHVVETNFVINPDGSVIGEAWEGSNSLDISFTARNIASQGEYLAYFHEVSPGGGAGSEPVITLAATIPEPSFAFFSLLSLPLVLMRRRGA